MMGPPYTPNSDMKKRRLKNENEELPGKNAENYQVKPHAQQEMRPSVLMPVPQQPNVDNVRRYSQLQDQNTNSLFMDNQEIIQGQYSIDSLLRNSTWFFSKNY